MSYLADTNILLRFISPSDPNHALVRSAIFSLLKQDERVCYTPQNLVEFWNVCTRPTTSRGGFGLTIEDTNKRAQVIEKNLTLLPDSAGIHRRWQQLVIKYQVRVSVESMAIINSLTPLQERTSRKGLIFPCY